MSDHDPFCARAAGGLEEFYQCSCALIRRVRDDERREAQLDLEAGIVYRDLIRDDVLADLRAQVQALRDEVKLVRGVERPSASEGALIAYSRVLELLNGGSGA